jgi:hypothetical protein
MRALSTTLIIVISAVVILVAALVVLTIFGQGASQVATLAQARTSCQAEGSSACSSSGVLPLTWNVPTKNVEGTLESCAYVMRDLCSGADCTRCTDFGFSTPQTE